MEILTLGDVMLREKAQAITDINEEVIALAREMLETMRGSGVGLAAPQIGRSIRLFVTQFDDDPARIFINPSILGTSEDLSNYEEGCLSIPGTWADVKRPSAVRIQAWNERGRPFTLDAEGFLARVIQHEYDHLEGTLFIDRISEIKRNRLVEQYEKKRKA